MEGAVHSCTIVLLILVEAGLPWLVGFIFHILCVNTTSDLIKILADLGA